MIVMVMTMMVSGSDDDDVAITNDNIDTYTF